MPNLNSSNIRRALREARDRQTEVRPIAFFQRRRKTRPSPVECEFFARRADQQPVGTPRPLKPKKKPEQHLETFVDYQREYVSPSLEDVEFFRKKLFRSLSVPAYMLRDRTRISSTAYKCEKYT